MPRRIQPLLLTCERKHDISPVPFSGNSKIAGKDVYFSAKWVYGYHEENRVKGDYAYMSFMLSF